MRAKEVAGKRGGEQMGRGEEEGEKGKERRERKKRERERKKVCIIGCLWRCQ